VSDDRAAAYIALCADLEAEHRSLAGVLASATVDFDADTPAEGWTIRDQLSHLAGFDEAATTSLSDPDAFRAELARRIAEGDDPIEGYRRRGRAGSASSVIAWWADANRALLDAAAEADPRHRVPWYGPDMSVMSSITARVMETWAHGVDIRDALGVGPEATRRLRHVCHIGVGARPFAYAIREMAVPDEPVDVVLDSPDGTTWSWGPGGAADVISGSALGFALLATQRRHADDTDVTATGDAAREWLGILQAFAGPPGTGRAPLP